MGKEHCLHCFLLLERKIYMFLQCFYLCLMKKKDGCFMCASDGLLSLWGCKLIFSGESGTIRSLVSSMIVTHIKYLLYGACTHPRAPLSFHIYIVEITSMFIIVFWRAFIVFLSKNRHKCENYFCVLMCFVF